MLYGKYSFHCVLENNAELPAYKGSTFRGVFGVALKNVVCALRRQECDECLLNRTCVYSYVFETPGAEGDLDTKKRIAAPPHPFVIEPPETQNTSYAKGQDFDFSLLLFGKGNDYFPYFVYAIEQMGMLGIGKKVDGKRAMFSLKRVTANGSAIYAQEDRKIKRIKGLETLQIAAGDTHESGPVTRLSITLVTPLRLKFQNRLETALPFHVLVRAMLRRISTLCTHYDNGEPPLDYRGLVRRAEQVQVEHSSLQWIDWRRYSNRQEQEMLMGGLMGDVTYAGDLSEFVPLIRFCEKVHLGKQTSFGLGKIELTGIDG